MDEFNDNESQVTEEVHEPEPMGHLDKMVGVFIEPGETFYAMSKHDPKTADWLLPLVLLILISIITVIISFSNPEIKAQMMLKQREAMEKQFEEQVASGAITQEQADKSKEMAMNFMGNPIMAVVVPTIGITIMTFLWFFFFSLVGWLIAKSLYHDQGSYLQAMTALGLPLYISILGIIVMLILGIMTGKMVTGVNLALISGADVKTFAGYIQSKIDVFGIWFYVVTGIAFAKIFKSQSVGKYITTSVGLWLFFSILLFILASSFSMFDNFIQ
jgi:hypothetical protein